MAQVNQDMEPPKWCQASTAASLQRFTRGPGSVVTLLNLLTDSAKLEKRISRIYKDFDNKWRQSVMTKIGSNLAYDQVNSIMKVWLETVKQKEDLHAKCLNAMYAPRGPIETLHMYIHSEDVNASRKATQSLYERTKKKQLKLEKEIDQLKEDFYLSKDKAVDFKPQLDEAFREREDNPTKFQVLLGHWQKLEAESKEAKTSYKQKLHEEKSQRMTFIEEMKRFQKDSDAYEMVRLENLQSVLGLMLKCNKSVEIQRKETLQPVFDEGISDLDRLNIEREIALFNQFYVYEHKFPQDELHPSEIKAEKKSGKESSMKASKSKDNDIVQVLPAKDNTTVFVQTRVDSDDDMDSWKHSHPVTLTTPRPVITRYLPDVEIPNIVSETIPDTAPIRKETIVENYMSLSESDSDDEAVSPSFPMTQSTDPRCVMKPVAGQKIKVYALKDFTARSKDELTFKAGQKIYICDHESAADGRAYGYIKKGKLIKKKKYGFFPEQLITTTKLKVKHSILKKKSSKKGTEDSKKS
ncbi:protein kinase C and casein kinase substrate in neurons protein 2-like [Haliotis cracherodii]|uniref:protein kinase C and casein kinase substrate in neurons protein 2-like n=1 Tax=Haliotis cracherodii TaxID=6455 RepID=UPI0039EC063C